MDRKRSLNVYRQPRVIDVERCRNVARQPFSSLVRERSYPCRSIPTTIAPRPVHESSTMTVSRESGRGLAAVSRERVPWKEPLQDTTRLYADLPFPDPENVGTRAKNDRTCSGRSTARQQGLARADDH